MSIYNYKATGGVYELADDALTALHGTRSEAALGFWVHYPEKLDGVSQTGDVMIVEQRATLDAPAAEDVIDGSVPHHWLMAPGDVLELECRSASAIYAIAVTGTPTVYAGDKL